MCLSGWCGIRNWHIPDTRVITERKFILVFDKICQRRYLVAAAVDGGVGISGGLYSVQRLMSYIKQTTNKGLGWSGGKSDRETTS